MACVAQRIRQQHLRMRTLLQLQRLPVVAEYDLPRNAQRRHIAVCNRAHGVLVVVAGVVQSNQYG